MAKKRDSLRKDKTVGAAVIEKLAGKISIPNMSEGIDSVIFYYNND
jgi:DNA-directed RNA polymerase subunit K/omega